MCCVDDCDVLMTCDMLMTLCCVLMNVLMCRGVDVLEVLMLMTVSMCCCVDDIVLMC
jgi:hypothetical protein